jgi:hypothetical protein
VTAGLKCAPDRFPHGEQMIATAVKPIAIPIKTFFKVWWISATGESELKRITEKKLAETIKVQRHHPSIKYSGQWLLSAFNITCLLAIENHWSVTIYSIAGLR